jgi:predicted GH43/DUF377 family glycosyl hydrolase
VVKVDYKNVLYISASGDNDQAMYAKRHLYSLIKNEVNVVWKTYKIDDSVEEKNKFNALLLKHKHKLLAYSEVVIDGDPEVWSTIIKDFKVKLEGKTVIGRCYCNLDTVPSDLVQSINSSPVNVVSVESEYNKKTFEDFGVTKPIIIEKCPDLDLWTFGVDIKNESAASEAYLSKSIFDQGQDVQILNFPYSQEDFFFNPCIFAKDDKVLMLARYANLTNDNPYEFTNTIRLFELDDDFQPSIELPFKIKDELEKEQYEDPRLLYYKDKYYLSCANYILNRGGFIHQKVLVFDKNFNHIDNLHINYDGNGAFTNSNTIHQKNWAWFVHEDKLMLEYRMNPHVVLEIDSSTGEVIAEHKHFQDLTKLWKFGECRAGGNPILKDDGFYHGFFHSSLPWKNHKRRYFMGYYKFESKPPFKIVEMSEKPILYGNEYDERTLKDLSPLVVFPCGAIEKDGKFIVSFGFNDEKIGIIKII